MAAIASILCFGRRGPRAALCLLVALGMAVALASRAQALLYNVQAVNVTPTSFSIVGPGSGQFGPGGSVGIAIFADAAGQSNLSSQLAVELYPLNTGDPALTSQYARLTNQSALQLATISHGLFDIRVTGCAPSTTYYYRVTTVSTNGQTSFWPGPTTLDSVTTSSENAFAVQSDTLVLSVNGGDVRGMIVTLAPSNAVPLAAVVGDGAGTNEAYFSISDLINAATGSNDAPEGAIEFTAEILDHTGRGFAQSFLLQFSPNFGVGTSAPFSMDDFFDGVSVGSIVLQAGSSGSVPIYANALDALTEISFKFNLPVGALGSLGLTSTSAKVGSASLQSLSPGVVQLTFSAANGASFLGSNQIGQLSFTTSPALSAGYIALAPDSVSGTNVSGETAYFSPQSGRITVVTMELLLEAQFSGGSRNLILYTVPGNQYQIQSSTNITSTNFWTDYSQVTPTNLVTTISNVDSSAKALFFRARLIGPAP